MRTNLLNKDPLTPGTCEWCGNNCELADAACSLSCEAQLNRLEAAQGRMVLRVLKRWRKHRGRRETPGEGAMTEVAQLTDRFLKTDRLRREAEQAKKRAKASMAETLPEPKGQAQTAAPVTDQPDDAQEDWIAREGRLAQYGDLDAPMAHEDPSKRGFQPR